MAGLLPVVVMVILEGREAFVVTARDRSGCNQTRRRFGHWFIRSTGPCRSAVAGWDQRRCYPTSPRERCAHVRAAHTVLAARHPGRRQPRWRRGRWSGSRPTPLANRVSAGPRDASAAAVVSGGCPAGSGADFGDDEQVSAVLASLAASRRVLDGAPQVPAWGDAPGNAGRCPTAPGGSRSRCTRRCRPRR